MEAYLVLAICFILSAYVLTDGFTAPTRRRRVREMSCTGRSVLPEPAAHCRDGNGKDMLYGQRSAGTDGVQALFYVCCACQHVWSTLDARK